MTKVNSNTVAYSYILCLLWNCTRTCWKWSAWIEWTNGM